MAIQSVEELFHRLIYAHKKTEIDIILDELGDRKEVGLNNQFGSLKCKWVPYGGRDSNESTIGLASKAGRSLTERITNGEDAMLELAKSQHDGELPKSPRRAAADWFGRAETGPKSGLYSVEDKEGDLSRSLCVVLCDSGLSGAPTVDVVDAGIGLAPEEMPSTILSLQQGNKVKKPYLIGAFGQGGSSTLGFSKYAIIVSRPVASPDRVGFTLVRLIDPGTDYDLDVYAYLTIEGNIPFVRRSKKDALPLYKNTKLKRPPELLHGTLVRHIGFELSGLDKGLGPAPGNLYHYLHLTMFDPLIPFRAIDIRGNIAKDERIGGSRNRLMKLVGKGEEDDGDSGRTSVIHHKEMEDIVPLGSEDSHIGVEYWVIEAKRTTKGELHLRSSSNELFVQRGYPVIATLNGQNQGELPAKFIKDLGLGMVSRHIVVHLDTSRCNRRVRRELFTTTREGFKDGPQLNDVMTTLARMLSEDERLKEIEQALADRLVNRENQATNDKVKKQITRLLRDAGFTNTADGESEDLGGEQEGGAGGTEGGGGGGGGGNGGSVTLPLSTKPYPDVSIWEIVSPKETSRIRINGRSSVRIETDADARFDAEGLISLKCEPRKVEVASFSALKGGRKQWRLRVSEGAQIGDSGTVTAVLQTPNGGELRSTIRFEVAAPIDAGGKGKKGKVPDFEIVPISPDKEEDLDTWVQLWPQHEGASRMKKAEVAYKVLTAGDKTVVYYSTGYGPYVERLERLNAKSKILAELFHENYQVWIGYHAILQLPDDQKADDDNAAILEEERCRVATVQLRVATELAELQRKISKAVNEADE
ncbi:MAG: hypothetical protein AB7N71_00650 [Phycisphaerae bacterium]